MDGWMDGRADRRRDRQTDKQKSKREKKKKDGKSQETVKQNENMNSLERMRNWIYVSQKIKTDFCMCNCR